MLKEKVGTFQVLIYRPVEVLLLKVDLPDRKFGWMSLFLKIPLSIRKEKRKYQSVMPPNNMYCKLAYITTEIQHLIVLASCLCTAERHIALAWLHQEFKPFCLLEPSMLANIFSSTLCLIRTNINSPPVS